MSITSPCSGGCNAGTVAHDGKIKSRLRRLEHVDASTVSTYAGAYRLGWLLAFVDQDRAWRRQIRQLEAELDTLLDAHGTTFPDEPGIGPIAAATLIYEVAASSCP